jgi:flavin-dependent dehydrogenase
VLLAGDAAGYVDAITGEGIGIAFAAARALVAATTHDDGATRYAATLTRLVRRHRWCTRALLAVAARPALRRRFLRALQASPGGWSGLLALSNGTWGWRRALPSLGAIGARLVNPGRGPAPARLPASR